MTAQSMARTLQFLLDKVGELFPREVKISLIVRTPNRPDLDGFMSDDEIDQVIAALQRIKVRDTMVDLDPLPYSDKRPS